MPGRAAVLPTEKMHGLPLLPMFVFTVLCSRPVHPSTTQVDIKGRSPSSKVSRLIHQSWVDLEVPDKFKEWQESWTRLNPGWKYVMWTDDANRCALVPQLRWQPLPPAFFKHSSHSTSAPLQGACGEVLQMVCFYTLQAGGLLFPYLPPAAT